MDIEEGPFQTLDIVKVAMNSDKMLIQKDEVAMNSDNNEFRKSLTNSANLENIILPKIKSACSY